jgi:hypothetical protein
MPPASLFAVNHRNNDASVAQKDFLNRTSRKSLHLKIVDTLHCNMRSFWVTEISTPTSADPTLEVAERQLAMLGRLALIAAEVSEAFASSAKAAAKAEDRILADEYFVPEVGRARACGAKEAAESFQKVSRALRLTLVLEMNLAEIVRDIRAGVVTSIGGLAFRGKVAETPAVQGDLQDHRRAADSCADDRESDFRSRDSNGERLVEFERLDVLSVAPFRDTVERIGVDLCVAVDWSASAVGRPDVEHKAPRPRPPGGSKRRPPESAEPSDRVELSDRMERLPP